MQSSPTRLESHLVISAITRQCSAVGIGAYLRHKGDRERGQVFLLCGAPGSPLTLLERATAFTGDIVWRQRGPDLADDRAASEAIAKLLAFDSEINVLEVEAPLTALTLDAPIELTDTA